MSIKHSKDATTRIADEYMRSNGIKQAEFGRMIGLSQQSISAKVTGKVKWSLDENRMIRKLNREQRAENHTHTYGDVIEMLQKFYEIVGLRIRAYDGVVLTIKDKTLEKYISAMTAAHHLGGDMGESLKRFILGEAKEKEVDYEHE